MAEWLPGRDAVQVMDRRTKIVATLGPASNSREMVRRLLRAGVNVFRLNFSHGSHEQHVEMIAIIRDEAIAANAFIPIIGDIQGPKIRIGDVEGIVHLDTGAAFLITTEPVAGDSLQVSTPFSALPNEVKPGHRIMINDGLVELMVLSVEDGTRVRTRVVHGGPISSRKGMNFPDTELSIPAITEKDRDDLRFAVAHGIDYVAASFIRRREDIEELRRLLDEQGGQDVAIIAKLEKAQAIESLDAILQVSDGVMVARGDLGVELPPEIVPIIQKRILKQASYWGRFAITATQMLESMTANSRPTRAEASDVANAIFDGSDAVMLSAETASGAYPVESVEMMSRIVIAAEQNPQLHVHSDRDPFHDSLETDEFTDALAGATNYTAEQIGARYIVVFTQSGFTARLMSKFTPRAPIIALTSRAAIARRMNILWGVMPWVLESPGEYHEQIVAQAEAHLVRHGMVEEGNRIVILMGSPLYERARTNVMRVHRVGG
ncbi:MAG TPA: pyruvate kinase [Thermoanaerobaculia bacterium]|nr:pyruvate kinase [Thermoanaerobaculia bacterium]